MDQLVELGKRFDYLTYPKRDPGFHEGKDIPAHPRMLMMRYLLKHLPPAPLMLIL